jgi:proline iminopeptidase
MEAHYFANECFMRPNQLLDDAGKLTGIPGVIVQGRYDLLCPPATAHALASRWVDAELRVVERAGHTLYDPGVRNAVMKAIADVASRIAS